MIENATRCGREGMGNGGGSGMDIYEYLDMQTSSFVVVGVDAYEYVL